MSSSLTQVHDDVWFVKQMFDLGEGQTDGLRWSGLRDRIVALLGPKPLEHRALNPSPNQESSAEELEVERSAVMRLTAGEHVTFPLDTTMGVVRTKDEEGASSITLISPVLCDDELVENIKRLGTVETIIVPSLQHWIFTEELCESFPNAKVLWAPPACGEDLANKMPSLADNAILLQNGNLHPDLEARLLEGAPLNMNEFAFFHKPSGVMIVSDAFYGGYREGKTSWFQRLWFKLTKAGSFKAARLPVYRTIRVKTDGDVPTLLASVDSMCDEWEIEKIIFAHGTNPFTEDASITFKKCWYALTEQDTSSSSKVDHSIKPTTTNQPQPQPQPQPCR